MGTQGKDLTNKYGSKERLFELMKGVNKTTINEDNSFDGDVDIFDKKNYAREEDDDFSDQDVADLDSEKSIDGEKLVGGNGDGETEQSFDIEQIKKGLKVELEHTDDQLIALEIVYDHLTESGTYYDELEKMEANFRDEDKKSDDELISSLMGWSPRNVGDYQETGGDNYVENNNDATSDENDLVTNKINEDTTYSKMLNKLKTVGFDALNDYEKELFNLHKIMTCQPPNM